MKRSNMASAIILGALGLTMGAAGPTQRETPLRYYRSIERIGRAKQHDQQDKLVRRANRQLDDDQLWQRQRAKWG